MNDHVTREERVNPVAEPQQREPYADQVTGVINKLGAPKPELLWILLLVLVFQGANLWEATRRAEFATHWQSVIGERLAEMEIHRATEARRLQEQNAVLIQALSRQSDRMGQNLDEAMGVKVIEKLSPRTTE